MQESKSFLSRVLKVLSSIGASLRIAKLPDAMNPKQKKAFVTKLLQEMKNDGQIEPDGVTRWATWCLPKERREEDS